MLLSVDVVQFCVCVKWMKIFVFRWGTTIIISEFYTLHSVREWESCWVESHCIENCSAHESRTEVLKRWFWFWLWWSVEHNTRLWEWNVIHFSLFSVIYECDRLSKPNHRKPSDRHSAQVTSQPIWWTRPRASLPGRNWPRPLYALPI